MASFRQSSDVTVAIIGGNKLLYSCFITLVYQLVSTTYTVDQVSLADTASHLGYAYLKIVTSISINTFIVTEEILLAIFMQNLLLQIINFSMRYAKITYV